MSGDSFDCLKNRCVLGGWELLLASSEMAGMLGYNMT